MDLPSTIARIAGMAVCLAFSAFFSGSETALFSLRSDRIAELKRGTGSASRAAVALLMHPRRLLTTILLGNMLVNILFFCLSTSVGLTLSRAYGASAGVAFGFLVLLLVLVLAEVLPKSIAVIVPTRSALLVSVPIRLIQVVLLPVTFVLNRITDAVHALVDRLSSPGRFVTPAELKMLLEMSSEVGSLDPDAGEMIAEVLDISDVKVSEVMVPRVDMDFFEVGSPASELLDLMKSRSLIRVAVFEGEMDNVLGIVRLKDICFRESQPLRALVHPIPFIPESARIENAIRQLIHDQSANAFVVDEYGSLVGFIRLEDMVEEIVGEITHEFEEQVEPIRRLGEGEYLISGDLGMREWEELFRLGLPESGGETVGGWIAELLGRIPKVGDEVRYQNIHLTVEAMYRFRVKTVRLTLLGDDSAGANGFVADEDAAERPQLSKYQIAAMLVAAVVVLLAVDPAGLFAESPFGRMSTRLLACLMASFFFSGIETGFYRMSLLRVKCRARAQDRRAQRLDRLAQNPQSFVATTLVGNNVANYAASVLVTEYIRGLVSPAKAEITATLVLSPVMLVFAEILPKILFQLRANKLMPRVSLLLVISRYVFRPLVLMLRAVQKVPERLLGRHIEHQDALYSPGRVVFFLTDHSVETGMTLYQKTLTRNILRLKRTRLRQVMIPLKQVFEIPAHISAAEFRNRIRGRQITRFPVYEGPRSNVIGILHLLDIIQARDTEDVTASELIKPVCKLSEQLSVAEALFELQEQHQTMVVVVDAGGKAVGVATVKDLVEEIVGELKVW